MPKKKKTTKKKAKKKNNNMSIARPSMADNKRWEIESAADTLLRAQEIKANAKLDAAAKKELRRREKAIKMARKA